VFLTYRARTDIDRIVAEAVKAEPIIDFEAADSVRHTLWRTDSSVRDRLAEAAARIPVLYIADGHHRAASAARARTEMKKRRLAKTSGPAETSGVSFGPGRTDADDSTFLAVAFPDDQVQILAYNRVVKDLGGLSSAGFLQEVGRRFDLEPGPAAPVRRGEFAMYTQSSWYTVRRRPSIEGRAPAGVGDAIAALDVSVLQDELLTPVLKITDIRTDARIEFVGGARGTGELERLVDSGRAAVAFSMYPVAVNDLMAVSDAGAIMPPKSTWFEPKLRDGLLIHLI
jgi:uncharacterized protein (DUF1015 family)